MILRDPRTLLGLFVIAVLGVVAVPFVLQADDPALMLRRRQLAAMTQAERERILRNFDQFTAMDESQRRQLAEFHAALEADKVNNHGRLNDVLRIYSEWSQSATPHQRDALQKEPDAVKRIALLEQLVEGQQEERLEVRTGSRAERLGPIPRVGRPDLEAMLEVISSKAPLDNAQRAQLEEYAGIRRSLKMFELLGKEQRTIRELLTDATMRQLLDAISDDQTRRQIETIPDNARPRSEAIVRRMKLSLVLFQAVEAELDSEVRRRKISEKNLNDYFKTLPEDEQDELLALTPGEFAHELRSRYVQTEWSSHRINMRLVRQFFRPQRPANGRPAEREKPLN